jgi:hypothetical protein
MCAFVFGVSMCNPRHTRELYHLQHPGVHVRNVTGYQFLLIQSLSISGQRKASHQAKDL